MCYTIKCTLKKCDSWIINPFTSRSSTGRVLMFRFYVLRYRAWRMWERLWIYLTRVWSKRTKTFVCFRKNACCETLFFCRKSNVLSFFLVPNLGLVNLRFKNPHLKCSVCNDLTFAVFHSCVSVFLFLKCGGDISKWWTRLFLVVFSFVKLMKLGVQSIWIYVQIVALLWLKINF